MDGISYKKWMDRIGRVLVSVMIAVLLTMLFLAVFAFAMLKGSLSAVSYTHLDVYKRQEVRIIIRRLAPALLIRIIRFSLWGIMECRQDAVMTECHGNGRELRLIQSIYMCAMRN